MDNFRWSGWGHFQVAADTSRMRSSNNLADFKVQQQKIALRELKKFKHFIELYYGNNTGIFDKIENLLDTEEIRLYINKN